MPMAVIVGMVVPATVAVIVAVTVAVTVTVVVTVVMDVGGRSRPGRFGRRAAPVARRPSVGPAAVVGGGHG